MRDVPAQLSRRLTTAQTEGPAHPVTLPAID